MARWQLTRWAAAACCYAACTQALSQTSEDEAQAPETTETEGQGAGLPAERIEELVAPIALYPDVLLAQILPAATYPIEIVKAARWLRTKPDPAKVDEQGLPTSVVALCNYPDVLYMLDKDLDWTNALGAAFLDQQKDVMVAIQELRQQAQDAGNLATNEQQTIVIEKEVIRIVPSQKEIIYVPTYDTKVVYVRSPVVVYVEKKRHSTGTVVATAAVSFGVGLAMGAWLNNDCDWRYRSVHYVKPGYWGGWHHRGAVAWGGGRAAGIGPRGGFVTSGKRGIAAGPGGGIAWNKGRVVTWRRDPVYVRPSYSGRYSSYRSYSGRTSHRSVSRTRHLRRTVDRGRDRVNRRPLGGVSRPGGDRRASNAKRPSTSGRGSAFNPGDGRSGRRASDRGKSSRGVRRDSSAPQRSQRSSRSAGKKPGGAFGDYRGKKSTNRASKRGGASRSSAKRPASRSRGARRP